ncbi:MAG TPA: imidazole glycerol phosphate synthase subunit HisH [Candidatus Hydrogenedentes bacterium]|nr:imidazole glycerol phosphate synthase subunit HisH [Candidatus Hydrogenedentota bacterium]HOV60640.1 imidazole glycerol phosphate synthase subunit HisH [Candidatus Hydrogenedentota bacterium]
MIAIIDYGMGNLGSVRKALDRLGYRVEITSDPDVVGRASGLILPGVGAFGDGYRGLVERGLVDVTREAARNGRPFLGVCLGLQLLFEESEESPGCPGLGILPGRVVRFASKEQTGLKVPHMGWNQIVPVPGRNNPLLPPDGRPYVYFVHSYYAAPAREEDVLATCEYGITFPAMVGRDNIFAVQFHPEKSQADGLAILERFARLTLS